MLADLVRDRTGGDVAKAGPEALRRTHAAAFESAELDLEAAGKTGRVRAHGFVASPGWTRWTARSQFCRAYLPAGYAPDRRWPLVVQLHGYNPAEPGVRALVGGGQPAPRASTRVRPGRRTAPSTSSPTAAATPRTAASGRSDVLRAIAEAKKALAIDEDRVYLMGDSMGGWGTWQVATRNPRALRGDRARLRRGRLPRAARRRPPREAHAGRAFLQERRSSWAQAEGLLERADPRLARRRGQGGERRVLALGGEDAPALGLRRALPRAARAGATRT